jgi:protein-tyrosine phosphatase
VHQLPDDVRKAVSPQGTVGLRVPGHSIILDVLEMVAGPLVLSSANRGGGTESRTADEALEALRDDVHLVLDDGPTRYGQPSSVVRVNGRKYEVLRVGAVPEKTLRRLTSTMVLFVCTGNTCRSPMAEMLFRRGAAERLGCPPHELEDHGVIVMSAGIAATTGAGAASEAVRVMAGMGLDLSMHETQPLTDPLLRHADRIYVMTQAQRQAIVNQWPGTAGRVQLVCPGGNDIADPIGGPVERYERCAEQLQKEIQARLDELDLAGDNP